MRTITKTDISILNEFVEFVKTNIEFDLTTQFDAFVEKKSKTPTPEDLVMWVSLVLGLNPSDVKSKKRTIAVHEARVILTSILRKQGMTWALIGLTLGDRDHSTIMNAYKVFEDLFDTDKYFQQKYNKVVTQLAAFGYDCTN